MIITDFKGPLLTITDENNKLLWNMGCIDKARLSIQNTDNVIHYSCGLIATINRARGYGGIEPDTQAQAITEKFSEVGTTPITRETIAREARYKQLEAELEAAASNKIKYIDHNGKEVTL